MIWRGNFEKIARIKLEIVRLGTMIKDYKYIDKQKAPRWIKPKIKWYAAFIKELEREHYEYFGEKP